MSITTERQGDVSHVSIIRTTLEITIVEPLDRSSYAGNGEDDLSPQQVLTGEKEYYGVLVLDPNVRVIDTHVIDSHYEVEHIEIVTPNVSWINGTGFTIAPSVPKRSGKLLPGWRQRLRNLGANVPSDDEEEGE